MSTNEAGPSETNDVYAVIDRLEAVLRDEIANIEASTPGPNAPVEEQVAFGLRAALVEATSGYIEEVREQKGFSDKLKHLVEPPTDKK